MTAAANRPGVIICLRIPSRIEYILHQSTKLYTYEYAELLALIYQYIDIYDEQARIRPWVSTFKIGVRSTHG